MQMRMDGFPGGIQVHRAAEIAELRRKMETKQHPRIVHAYWHKHLLDHNFSTVFLNA